MTPFIIGLSGSKRAGKNFVGDLLLERLGKERGFHVEQMAFADEVKDYAEALRYFDFGGIRDAMRGMGIPAGTIRLTLLRLFLLRLDPRSWAKDESGKRRFLLQRLGTEVFRDHVSDTYWVDVIRRRIVRSPADVVILTDVRFPNEADICHLNVRVRGPFSVESLYDHHRSEDPDSLVSDVVVDNSERGATPDLDGVMSHVPS